MIQKRVPPGWGLGMEVSEDGRAEVLDAGTVGEECRTVNADAVGPKGLKGVSWVSEAIIEVPVAV